MTKITQKDYEAIAIYKQKEKLFELKGKIQTLEKQLKIAEKKYARALWWLNEIVNNHRHTPISTAEIAIKELEK